MENTHSMIDIMKIELVELILIYEKSVIKIGTTLCQFCQTKRHKSQIQVCYFP